MWGGVYSSSRGTLQLEKTSSDGRVTHLPLVRRIRLNTKRQMGFYDGYQKNAMLDALERSHCGGKKEKKPGNCLLSSSQRLISLAIIKANCS